jgi:hypothetical protein
VVRSRMKPIVLLLDPHFLIAMIGYGRFQCKLLRPMDAS